MAVICNIGIIILELIGASRRPGGIGWKMFAFYTMLSNAAALFASVLFLATGGSRASVCLRYTASCMLLMTAFVSLCILVPMGAGFKRMMLSDNGLYHHTLCPLVSTVSYVLFEPHVKIWLLPALVTLVYGIVMEILNAAGKADGPYPFFRVRHQSRKATVLWTLALFAAIAGFSAVLALPD